MTEIDESKGVGVKKVCQDFQVREDGALAYRLQEEEIDRHYKRNKQESKKIRDDVKTAKITYLEEVKNARLLPDQELPSQDDTHKWIARELEDKLQSEEARDFQQRREVETNDERIALEIQEKEKRDARQKERERIQRSLSESEDERLARHLQEREAIRAERARQYRREQELIEERERRQMIQQGLANVQLEDEPSSVPPRGLESVVNGSSVAPRRSSQGIEGRSKCNVGGGAVVRLPETNHWQQVEAERASQRLEQESRREPNQRLQGTRQHEHENMSSAASGYDHQHERLDRKRSDQGGRLEPDRIVMADGTAIDLFDNEHDRERALKKNRERRDEEFARMLQEEENRRAKGPEVAEDDRKVAIECQDRELAKQLQRREYIKYQKLRREKEFTRAQSVPQEGVAEVHEGRRRLPSYEEATNRTRLPDLLPNEIVAQGDKELGVNRESKMVRSNTSPGPSLQRSHLKSSRDHGHPSSLDRRRDSGEPEVVWAPRDYQHSSPMSSLERSGGGFQPREHVHRSSHSSNSSSSGHHYQGQSHSSQPFTERPFESEAREEVWERFEDESLCLNRNVMRSYTNESSSLENNDGKRHFINIAESIDPTFRRRQSSESNAPDSCNHDSSSAESTPKKSLPLVQPQRRRSTGKKKNQENCKQQ